jgi:hypothetical protein
LKSWMASWIRDFWRKTVGKASRLDGSLAVYPTSETKPLIILKKRDHR